MPVRSVSSNNKMGDQEGFRASLALRNLAVLSTAGVSEPLDAVILLNSYTNAQNIESRSSLKFKKH